MPPSEPLRLAAASSSLGLGGSTTFLVNLARALKGTPHRLQVVGVTEENAFAAEFAAAEAPVTLVPVSRLIYEDRLAAAYQAVAAAAPHALLAGLGAESFELLRLTPRGVARIGIIQSHDPLPYALARQYAGVLDAMVGVSGQIAAELRAMPEFAHVRVVEIPYGIHFPPLTPRPPQASGAPLRVLYLGRIAEEQKRFSRVVELMRAATQEGLPVQFTIAGAGPEEAGAREALCTLPSVTWAGAVPYAQVPALLANHDVFILLSDYEGLPLSLLEAMGAGVVPVVSDLPSGIGQAVDETCGFRVPVGDVPAALAALRTLCGSPELRERLSAAAAARARSDFSSTRMAGQYLELIAEIRGDAPAPVWPAKVTIPTPHSVSPAWLYHGLGRALRRAARKIFPRS